MRKIISISLLSLIFISHTGYYIIYSLQQHQIKQAIKNQLIARLPDSSFELIVAEENHSFRWEEEGKEFYQDGRLYDVVKSVIKNGKTILYCINDKKEAALICQLGKAAKPDNGKDAKNHFNIQLVDMPAASFLPDLKISQVSNTAYFCFDTPIIAFSKNVTAPPPRVIPFFVTV